MRYTWDEAKRRSNIEKHGIDFAAVSLFEWHVAWVRADVRYDYTEARLRAVAPIGDRLFAMAFTIERRSIRVISLRRASRRETADYAADI